MQPPKPRKGPIRMKVLYAIVDQRWLSPPHAPMCDLLRLAELGFATQCGRLFHPTPEADRIAKLFREPKPLQGSLFA